MKLSFVCFLIGYISSAVGHVEQIGENENTQGQVPFKALNKRGYQDSPKPVTVYQYKPMGYVTVTQIRVSTVIKTVTATNDMCTQTSNGSKPKPSEHYTSSVPTLYPSSVPTNGKPKPSQYYTPSIPILYPSSTYTTSTPSKPSKTVSDYKPSETAPSNNGSFDERSIEMLCRVNALRAEVGKKPYKFDKRLIDAAQKHSEDQAAQKQMSHTGSKIPYFLDRIKAAGYPAKDGSENVAWNQRTVAWVVDSWRKSSGHYRAIIGDYECFGWGEKNFYWTQTFGSGAACSEAVVPYCKNYPAWNPNDIWNYIK